MKKAIPCLCISAVLALAAAGSHAETQTVKFQVAGSGTAQTNVPVAVSLTLPEGLAGVTAVPIAGPDGEKLLGQLTAPSLLCPAVETPPGQVARQLWLILPSIGAREAKDFSAEISTEKPECKSFAWTDTPGLYCDLAFAGRPVLRYMYEKLDESTPQRREETYKVYHHLYDPQGGQLVTKGPGGLYPHHRGIFFGFSRITYGEGKTANTWGCGQGESQTHEEFLSAEAGPVLGRHRVRIAWHGKDGGIFAEELRELTVYNTPGGTLVEFASKLTSTGEKVHLDGDPQHAGFHFRASQEVPDKTAKKTYYLRPDGKDEPGKFRNWPADKEHVNLPWNALSFVLGEERFTCCYLDRPTNPKEARFSERDYGRFGSYFVYDLDKENDLELDYRLWLQEGEMTVEQVDTLDKAFVDPPTVKLE